MLNYEFAKRYEMISALLLLGIVVWFAFFKVSFLEGTLPPDTMTYSMLARNIVRGNGIAHDTAKTIEVAALGHFPVHDTHQPPFWPIILSISFFIFGVSDLTVILTSSFFFLILIPLVFLLSKEMFGQRVAAFSALFTTLNLSLLKFSISGLTECFYTVLITFSFLLLYRASKKMDLFLVGLIYGVAYMTRPQTIFYIPVIALFILLFRKEGRYSKLILFIVGFVLVLTPFTVRKHIYEETTPFSMATIALQHDGGENVELLNQYRSLRVEGTLVDPIMYVIRNPKRIFNKVLSNLEELYKGVFCGLWSPFFIALFFACTLVMDRVKRTQEIKILAILLIGFNIVGCSLATPRARYLLPLLPVIIIFGSAFFINAWDSLNLRRKYKMALLVCLALLFVLPLPGYVIKASSKKMVSIRNGTSCEGNRYHFVKKMIQDNTKKGDVLISNNHSVTGWYGDRKVVLFPLDISDINAISDKYVNIDGIFLESGQMEMWNPSDEWWSILKSKPERVIDNFVLVDSFSDGVTEAVLYVRK